MDDQLDPENKKIKISNNDQLLKARIHEDAIIIVEDVVKLKGYAAITL
jgi:hypothetical protein